MSAVVTFTATAYTLVTTCGVVLFAAVYRSVDSALIPIPARHAVRSTR